MYYGQCHCYCSFDYICIFQVDINANLDSQGPFHIFLHKLTDVLAHAESGDHNVCETCQSRIFHAQFCHFNQNCILIILSVYFTKATTIVTRVQEYIHRHPEMIVIDPIENVRNLRNRHKSYEIIQAGMQSNGQYKFYNCACSSYIDKNFMQAYYKNKKNYY